MIKQNDQMRISRLESVCEQIRSEMEDVMQGAYAKAVESGDEERAADIARKIRNKKLNQSDKHCTFDKMLPEIPAGAGFSDWIEWLKKLAEAANGAWGIYRKALRDLPEQEGFPMVISWPTPPEEDEGKKERYGDV